LPTEFRVPPADGTGLAGQHEKGGLENVLSVLHIVQRPPTHAPNERPVPLHQGSKSGFIASDNETFEQLPVRQARGRGRTEHAMEVPKDRVKLTLGHESALPCQQVVYFIMVGQTRGSPVFLQHGGGWAFAGAG
jgi:hypothetical protein